MVMVMPASPVDRTSDRPAYKQVADRLREQLDRGELVPGDQLPSESDLISRYAVSRATARRGLAVLINEGRAESIQGRGVYVRRQRNRQRLVIKDPASYPAVYRKSGKGPMRKEAEEQGFEYGDDPRDVTLGDVTAHARVADLLDVPPGARVFRRARLIRVRPKDGSWRPAKLADSYLPQHIAIGDIRKKNTGPGGSYARIEEYGHPITHFEETVLFRMPSPSESRRLQLSAGVPVIDQTRVAFSDDRPVECFLAVMAGDIYELEYRISAT